MHGNRDFLLGPVAERACGLRPLSDPTLLDIFDRRYLLSHGDALCLADTEYLAFRAQVRSPEWQTAFLAQPLAQRLAVTRELRERSETKKATTGRDPANWADIDADTARAWLATTQAKTLIHGHTHRAQDHDLGNGLQRVVLSDWDATAQPARAEVLRLSAQGLQRLSM
jgi:UDP-2,3-diacylglucosamine hydrolase